MDWGIKKFINDDIKKSEESDKLKTPESLDELIDYINKRFKDRGTVKLDKESLLLLINLIKKEVNDKPTR